MADFVKICPQCQAINPEYENICTQCGQFIGMETPVARPQPKPAAKAKPKTAPPAATQRFDPAAVCFYLEAPGSDTVYTIHHGDVLGQAHPSSAAQVQIDANLQGSEFIHRQHCRFECKDGIWYVTALDQKAFQRDFTNPTFVNQHRLAPNTRQALKDGDRLGLSGVFLQVKII